MNPDKQLQLSLIEMDTEYPRVAARRDPALRRITTEETIRLYFLVMRGMPARLSARAYLPTEQPHKP